ncbi:MAG TPA: SUMF1/EgtB/PvdO family nonheme iron enzyme [Polyangiaceae bacterium]|nr:SUMF1/EgtB/PvdO family nonheme iron enzyme [Polyangiaceae bacterium]
MVPASVNLVCAPFLAVAVTTAACAEHRAVTSVQIAAGTDTRRAAATPRALGLGAMDASVAARDAGARSAIDLVRVDGGSPNVPSAAYIDSFWIDRTEVTVAAYAECVRAGSCSPPSTDGIDRRSIRYCNWGSAEKTTHPINCVDWDEALAYCAWRGERLPSEQEWLLAAMGTDGRTFPWGDAPPGDQVCWGLSAVATLGTCAVGSYPAGAAPCGALDMAGNVWEWTADAYDAEGTLRTIRGGSWATNADDPSALTASSRGKSAHGTRSIGVGFRCARGDPA